GATDFRDRDYKNFSNNAGETWPTYRAVHGPRSSLYSRCREDATRRPSTDRDNLSRVKEGRSSRGCFDSCGDLLLLPSSASSDGRWPPPTKFRSNYESTAQSESRHATMYRMWSSSRRRQFPFPVDRQPSCNL